MSFSAKESRLKFIMQWADNSLVIGHRLAEWCGHGPVLEQDIAMTNIALDLIGEARNLYQYAATIEGGRRDEDYYPYHRTERNFYNLLLTELPNGNFADTMIRHFLYDTYHYFFLREMKSSRDEQLSAIAHKSFKEVSYHLEFSSDWIRRLGDGTPESHAKTQAALDDKWIYSQECYRETEADALMADLNVGIRPESIRDEVEAYRRNVLQEATLSVPAEKYFQDGGKEGRHTENLGYILADMQYYQRTYPNATW